MVLNFPQGLYDEEYEIYERALNSIDGLSYKQKQNILFWVMYPCPALRKYSAIIHKLFDVGDEDRYSEMGDEEKYCEAVIGVFNYRFNLIMNFKDDNELKTKKSILTQQFSLNLHSRDAADLADQILALDKMNYFSEKQ